MSQLYSTIRLEGALFTRDFLMRLAAPQPTVEQLNAESYGLADARLRDAIGASWNTLSARYHRFQDQLANVSPTEPATGPTRQEWILPLLEELRFGRVQLAQPIVVTLNNAGGEQTKSYPISHAWNHVPLHLLGWNVPLDKRSPGVAGAAQTSPHALVQEALNRSDAHLWAMLCNGRKLRLLRDSAAIARQSYIEFDLEEMFEHEHASDFALLWMLCHASRFETRLQSTLIEGASEAESEDTSTTAIIETWLKSADVDGQRALDKLRDGVEAAIEAIATGFLKNPENRALREKLRGGEMEKLDFYRLNLRLVYRLLFVLVAEARDGLLLPQPEYSDARETYRKFFSLERLKQLSNKQRGGAHADGYENLKTLWARLREGEKALAIPALNGFLFAPMELDELTLSNSALYEALRALCFVEDRGARRAVNFQLDSQELGSVYESLLEMSPDINADASSFTLETLAGNERKTTGSYYTPAGLVKSLLDSALEPVLQRAAEAGEEAILSLKICDPACGSGAFLTAAARRIARVLALQRCGGDEPSREQTQIALRDVVSHCIFGVDLNPMAVELCKVALWMESLDPTRPLTFLDAHIRQGNALLGATPELLEDGIPDEAFAPLEGDDKTVLSALKKQNKAERAGQKGLGLFEDDDWKIKLGELQREYLQMDSAGDDDIEALRRKAENFEKWQSSAPRLFTHGLADAWCAAFVWRKVKDTDPKYLPPITHERFQKLRATPFSVGVPVQNEIARLATQYRWFHWHLEFPAVFADADGSTPVGAGGFDVVLGNPPWDQIQLDAREFFAGSRPDISNAANMTARDKMIRKLAEGDPFLYQTYIDATRQIQGVQHFAHSSGRFPLTSVGRLNTAPLFAELNRFLIGAGGRAGFIVPSGIATDSFTQYFFADLIQKRSLASLFDFENRRKIFPGIDGRMKFCLLTLTGTAAPADRVQFVFFAHRPEEAGDAERRVVLSADDILLLNPNTKTCPIFRSSRDAEMTKAIYRRVPILLNESTGENPWGFRAMLMFMMNTDSDKFHTAEQLRDKGGERSGNIWLLPDEGTLLPLYEAKMISHYDHRAAQIVISKTAMVRQAQPEYTTPEQHKDPDFVPNPRYWVNEDAVEARLKDKWDKAWLVGWRDITSSTNMRTLIPAIFPRSAVNDKFPVIFLDAAPTIIACFLACLSSFACDFAARQKLGGTSLKSFTLKQIPILPPATYDAECAWQRGSTLASWISSRVLELCYTAHDLEPFARDLEYSGAPFEWNPERRFQLRCELDATFFHLYGLTRDEAEYVLSTFPIVRRKDEKEFGEYRTARVILEMYDAMARGNLPYK